MPMGVIVDGGRRIDVALDELAPFMDQPCRREVEGAMSGSLIPGSLGAPPSSPESKSGDLPGLGQPPDFTVVFPTLLLTMTFHPNVRLEAAIARGYARWVTEVYLPARPRARAMLYLTVRDVDAAFRLVEEFGHAPGIIGAFVTNLLAPQSLENHDMRLYGLLQEHGLPLGFHPVMLWTESPLIVFDRYTTAYAYAYPFMQSAHLMNWIINGMPERFPRLVCLFYGAGVAWLNFVAHRLDQAYMRRPSEAPLLRDRPSHYMRRYFYGTHPLDATDHDGYLHATFRLIGSSQFIYASNFPQWDFDSPDAIRALEFLSPTERDSILGGNGVDLFCLANPREGRRGS